MFLDKLSFTNAFPFFVVDVYNVSHHSQNITQLPKNSADFYVELLRVCVVHCFVLIPGDHFDNCVIFIQVGKTNRSCKRKSSNFVYALAVSCVSLGT